MIPYDWPNLLPEHPTQEQLRAAVASVPRPSMADVYQAVRSSSEFATILGSCAGCEHFMQTGNHCRACGCGDGSVLGMVVAGRSCPVGRWSALRLQEIVMNQVLRASFEAPSKEDQMAVKSGGKYGVSSARS